MAEMSMVPVPAHQQVPMLMRYPAASFPPGSLPNLDVNTSMTKLEQLQHFSLMSPWFKMYSAHAHDVYRSFPVPLGVVFSQEELNMSLYGCLKDQGHALSGLKMTDLSHGIEKILSPKSSGQTSHHRERPSTAVNKISLNLPEGLKLVHTTWAGADHYGVFSDQTTIPKGHRFGPFTGKVVHTSEMKSNDDNSYMWEIFEEGRLSHFIDGRGPNGNWMSHVNCARYANEQNLIAVQMEGEIYYEVCKEIPRCVELLVWYGETYLQFMGIPVALRDTFITGPEDVDAGEGYLCERCGKVFAYKYYRDKHLKYTRCVDQGDRKFPCHLCTRSFEKRDRLRIHILHVHEKHRPHCCSVCGKSFSQSSSLNKHMRVHSGERPYKCVYCSKAFTASSILRTHIRQHSGEKPFKCKFCGKAFASHAAHDSHMRRTHARERELSKQRMPTVSYDAQNFQTEPFSLFGARILMSAS